MTSPERMTTVAEAMTPAPVTVQPETTIQAASAAMLDADAHAAIVVDAGKICGLVTADDVARALASGYDTAETAVGLIAERNPVVARADEPLAEVHQRMRALQRGAAAVAGRHGEALGLLVDHEAG